MHRPSRTLLIIDDSPEDRELYRRYLLRDQEYSYTILEAALGQQGLELWQQHHPDVILLDYRLPDLDGLDILARLQPSLQPAYFPVIMVTGQGNETLAVQAMKAGAQDYLIKEKITPAELHLTINEVIEKIRLRNELHQRIERERLIAQLTQQIHRSLDLNEILQTTVDEVRQFLQVDRVIIFQLESDGSGTVVTESVGAAWRSMLAARIDDPDLVQHYIKRYHQGAVTIQTNGDNSPLDHCYVRLLTQFQVKANLVVPIVQENQLWGMLIAHQCADVRPWQPLEVDLLKQLAHQIGIALHQAELYQQTQNELAERRRTETALRESEERFRQLTENINAVFWIAEFPERRVSYVSPAYQRLWGLNPQDIYKDHQTWTQLLHPEDQEATEKAFREKAVVGKFDEEYRIILPDGSLRWVRDRCFPLQDESGNVYRLTGIAEDITDRKQAEVSLVDQQQRYRYIFEAVGVSIWEEDFSAVKTAIDQLRVAGVKDFRQYFTTHPEFVQQALSLVRLRDVNQVSLKLFGAQNKAELLNSLHQIFTPEAQAVFIEELLAIAAEAPYLTAETVLQTLQGDRFHAFFTITFPPASESYERVLVSLLDISDRKQVEQALRQREEDLKIANERFELAAAAVNCLIYDWDVTQDRVERTEGLTRMLGYALAEADPSASWWRALVHPDDLRELTAIAADHIKISDHQSFEYRVRHKNGQYIYVLDQAIVVGRNPDGQPTRIVGSTTDITDRKQVDIEREQLLQRERAAKEEAERANQIKDEFLAVLSHELRSPLNPILGWAKLLQTRQLNQTTTAEALASIERNAKLQTQLIDDLLDVAKILRGKLSMKVAPVNLLFVIDSAIETVRTAAIAKSINLRFQSLEVDQSVNQSNPQLHSFQVSGDAARLQQIVWNLLSNAIKFTPVGGRVDVNLEKVRHQDRSVENGIPTPHFPTYAQITVTDTGKGISPDFLPHIFESFRQEDASTTRRYGGLGLGLAIVRSLVEAHGGTIIADSPGEGGGTTFTVQIPLLQMETVESQGDAIPEQELVLHGIRVLTVDDEVDTRELFRVLLTQCGAEVLTAASAAEVLASLESFRPDVLVSDIGMPGMDGYALLQRIRSLPPEKGGQIPAIALTAYAREEDEQRSRMQGFQQHLSKPIVPRELIQSIRALASKEI